MHGFVAQPRAENINAHGSNQTDCRDEQRNAPELNCLNIERYGGQINVRSIVPVNNEASGGVRSEPVSEQAH